jgi:hypothetical protein
LIFEKEESSKYLDADFIFQMLSRKLGDISLIFNFQSLSANTTHRTEAGQNILDRIPNQIDCPLVRSLWSG